MHKKIYKSKLVKIDITTHILNVKNKVHIQIEIFRKYPVQIQLRTLYNLTKKKNIIKNMSTVLPGYTSIIVCISCKH